MIRNKNKEMTIITPVTQYGNLTGVLNNNINTGNLNPDNPNNTIENLYDVSVNNLKENDILIYNGVNWINKSYSEVAKKYLWNLDGGNAQNYIEDNDDNNNDEPNLEKNLAEQALVVMNNFINSKDFQDVIKTNSNINTMNMEGNTINLIVSGKINNILNLFYNNSNINMLIGHIITSVYQNIGRDIRATLDNISNDINDSIIDWKISNSSKMEWSEKFFIYFSDSSGLFLQLNVFYIKAVN